MGVWGRGIAFVLLSGILLQSSVSHARGKHRPIFLQGDPNHPEQPYLVSKIDFPESEIPEFHFATAADTDPLKECPMESLPRDLASAVNQLVDKVKANVVDIKSIQGNRCAALADRLVESKNLMGSAINYQFLTGVVTANQDQINAGTVRAGALSSLISTAANVVDQNCLGNLDEAVVIQKLIGQVITLSGIFAGGWQGIGLASAGMLITSLPLFKSDIDHTLEMVAKYQEINKRGSFLCLYRQMQRTSCLLFAPHHSEVINGFDLSFKTGPAHDTEEALREIASTERGLFLLNDLKLLRHMVRTAESFLISVKGALFKEANIESFDKLKDWCRSSAISAVAFQLPDVYPKPILENIYSLYEKCQKIEEWQWENFLESGNTLNSVIWSSFRELYALTDYYNAGAIGDTHPKPTAPKIGLNMPISLGPLALAEVSQEVQAEPLPEEPDLRKVLNTLESKIFFTELKEKIEAFHNPYQGNQERLNYLAVTENVGEKFAKGSFKSFMKKDNADLSRRRWFSRFLRRDPVVRKKAVSAMLSLCQMFDPTLTCLYANRPEGDSFFKTWKNECVGSTSRLCKTLVNRDEIEQLLPDPKERAYFQSLCGIKMWLKGQ